MGVRYAGWARGSYICRCRSGHYSIHHPEGYNGSLVEGTSRVVLRPNNYFEVEL